MIRKFLCLGICVSASLMATEPSPVVIAHQDLPNYGHNGNQLTGLATLPLGALENEVWRSSLAVGGSTPPHTHEAEEVFILLEGVIEAEIGGERYRVEAPATLVCPAGIQHQLFNIGDVPTDQIVVLRAGSQIFSTSGELMDLPWRS